MGFKWWIRTTTETVVVALCVWVVIWSGFNLILYFLNMAGR